MKNFKFNQMNNPAETERDWNGVRQGALRGNPRPLPLVSRTFLLLFTLLTLDVGQMWGAPNVRGFMNSWGCTEMTQIGSTGVYYYTATSNGDFKVQDGCNWDNDKNLSHIDNSLGNITLSQNGDGNNISCSQGGTWYIVYNGSKVYATTTNPDTPSYPDRCIAGNGWGGLSSWNNSGGSMTNNGDGTYTWTSSSVTNGTDCRFKICECGTWTAVGYSNKVSGTNCSSGPSGESGDGSNICFQPAGTGTVTITYNSSTDNVTITCQAAPSTFTVTYDGNGKTSGSVPTDASSPYNSGATVTVKGNTGSMAKTGCTFDGWMTAQDGSGTTYAPGATFSISANTTLYARWIAKTIYVYDNRSWKSMNLYTFSDNKNGSWPGSGGVTSLGSSWYQIDILDGASNFILNGGGAQTVDLTTNNYTAGHSYETYDDSGIKLREKTFTVSFNMKSHGSAVSSQNIYYNGLVTEPSPAPSATGYDFGGWYKETGCTNAWNFGSDRITAARTLYAKWTAKNYTVPLNANDASATDGSATVYFDGTSMTIGTEPALTGYHVAGYYKQAEKTNLVADAAGSFGSRTVTGIITSGAWKCSTNNTPLYTEWEANTYYVSYNANGGSGSMSNSSHTYGTASNLSTCTLTPPSGYTFAGWATAADGAVVYADGASVSTLTATNGGTYPLYAIWDELSGGSVTLNAGTGGRVSKDNSNWGSSTTITDITSNQTVNIYAQANTGYTFSTWTKTSGSGSIRTNSASGQYNAIAYATDVVTASFTENMSALSLSRTIDEGSPSIAVPTVTGSHTTVGYVTTREITAAAAATGYAFTGWTITNGARTDGGAATANPITVQSNGDSEDVTVTANYAIQSYTISASNSNVTYSPASGTSFKYGATGSKMTITPKSGYKITAISSNNGAISASADNNAAGSWTVTGTMPAANVTLTVTTAAVSTVYLQGRFRIRTASGVESYKSLGSATASGWSSEWVTSGTSQISMTYNYITGVYDLVTYRSAAELKADNNLYFYFNVGGTNYDATGANTTVPSSKPGAANARNNNNSQNFYFNDSGDYINVVMHFDVTNKKVWYTGEAETVYSTTCYAGDHGSINAKGTAISKNSSSSVNIGTNSPISATPESGYSFDYWETSGDVSVADIYSASTTVTATAASGTVRAHYLQNSGWYLQGGFDDYDTWETSAKALPVDRPYRGISGVYYRPFSTLDNGDYFGMHDGTNKYSGHTDTENDYNYSSLDQVATLYVNSSKSFQAKTSFSNKWAVIKTTGTKKFWIQSPATYYTLSKSSDHGTLTLTENSYGGLETSQFASGERVNYSITAASGYVIDDIKIGNTTLFSDVHTASKSGNTTMPAGNTTFTVTYVPIYTVTYHDNGKTGGSAPVDASSPYIAGSDVTVLGAGTLAMTNYTFSGWNTEQYMTGTSYAASGTISGISANVNLYPVWTRAIPMENEDATTDVSATVYGTYMSTTLTAYDNPEKDGYTFGGWYTAVAGGDSYVISPEQVLQASKYHWTDASGRFDRYPTSTSSLYAKWTQTITLNANTANNGSGTNKSAAVTYKKNALTSITHCTPAAGYELDGYYTAATSGTKILNADGTFAGDDVADNTEDYIVGGVWKHAGATTLYAQYSEIMRTVSVAVNNSWLGSVDVTSLTSVGPATASAEVTATPTPGATLTNWTLPSGVTAADGYSASSNPISVNATAAGITITANFTETMHTVTLTNDNSTYGTVNTSSPVSVGQITAVQIQATPKSGYMFSKWVKTAGAGTVTYYTGAGNGQVTDASGDEKEITYICVTGNVTLKATWEPDRSSGYVVYYGNDGKNADGGTDASQARAWKDGKLYRPTTEESNTSSFTFTAGVGDVDKVIEFKIHKKTSPEAWYGYNSASGGKIDGNISNVTLNTSYGNGRLCITMPGSYTFTWNKSNNQLSISYPTDVYYVRGGWDSWSWSHPMTETSPSSGIYTATINMTEANHTYTANTEAGFKVLIAGQYYGKNSTTFTRTSSTGSAAVSGCNTSGQNMGLTTDYTGNYTFTYTVASNSLQVTYPTAYKVTYGKGSVDGSASNCSAVDIDNSSAAVTSNSTWVKSGNRVVLTAPDAKTGYSYDGWFNNNSGSGVAITAAANCTITVTSAATYYACYHENDYTVTVNAGSNGGVASGSVTGHKDTPVNLPAATANTGFRFVNWTVTTGTASITNATSANSAQINGMTNNVTVTANFAPKWSVAGGDAANTDPDDALGNWSETANKFSAAYTEVSSDWIGEQEITLDANTEYVLKMYDLEGEPHWYGTDKDEDAVHVYYANSNDVEDMSDSNGSAKDLHLHTAAGGTYTFKWNLTDKSLQIEFPTSWWITTGQKTIGQDDANGGSFTAMDGSSNDVKGGKFVANNATVTFTATPNTGYTFSGWYSDASCETAYVNGTGGAAISGEGGVVLTLSSITAAKTVYAKFTPISSTVTFDAATNGGSCTPTSKSVNYGEAYGELPVAVHAGDDSFLGWYTTPSGEGSLVTAETIVTATSNHTIYARYETTFEVVVQFKCGSDVLYPETRVNASVSSLTPTITAPEILGYRFSNWTETGGSYVTFDDDDAASTTINASGAATVVANYTVVPTVYFKNNLGWDSVFVTFDCSFIGGKQNVPSNSGHPYFAMTQLGATDVYYCAIPDSIVANNYAKWKWNIAFDNTNYGKTAKTTNVGTWDFYGGECVGRGDFDPKATMYIPFNGDTETRNSATFYKTGCWMKYNSTDPGYQVKVNKWVTGANSDTCTVTLSAPVAGGYEFSGKVWLKTANYGYGFKLYKPYEKNTNDLWYSNNGSIHSNTTTLPWEFATKIIVDGVEQAVTADTRRCELYTEAKGDYEFTVSFATGKPIVNVTYPVSAGDYRLVYKDLATWSNGAHSASWYHPSRVIKAKANAEDIVSFYIAYGSSPSILLQTCTSIDGSGNPVWNAGSAVTVGATATGIYNYKVTQDADKNATVTFDGSYDGNFYIRTDASDGGWSNYKTSGTNVMTYSEYAETEHDFTHYFTRYVTNGSNVKFCIANDYSECISDTLVNDTYTNEWLEAYANVRFMWDHRTNTVSRAYISGSSVVADRFLVLEGDEKLFDEDGNALTGVHQISGLNANEMKFTDDQNWIYEATVKAEPGARIKLTAKYNNKIQYFYGAEGARTDETTELLLGGNDANQYKVRVVYDFKTNRLIKAFIPDGAIGTDLEIDADLMIIRDHQEDAQQVQFNEDGALSKVKTVYGAMMFNKYTVNNKNREAPHGNASLTRYQRDLFYISFPFDVKLDDVFGFGTYGKHWILEYYDGAGRAAKGFWKDSESNWKFVMPAQRHDFTMKAFEGYILALDLDEMTESSSVWYNGVENVYIYFPSSAEVEDIEATNRLITIDQTGYRCTINRNTPDGDRRVKDSYWHCIGVPSFANYSSTLSPTDGGATIDWRSTSMPYLYEVNWSNNTLNITSSATFNFKATWSYLVQYAGTSIYWSQVNVTPSAIVARERTAPKNAEFRIELQKDGQKADQTFVRITDEENVTTGFDFNYDLSKEFNKNQANIYTIVNTMIDGDLSITQTAGNCLPMSEQTTVVPVGVKIVATGDYTFAIPEGTNGVGVTLIDNETGIRTPLSALDYTVNLTAGTYDQRFVIEISPVQQTPTGVEAVSDQPSAVRKVMIDGILYIIRGNEMFDATGRKL